MLRIIVLGIIAFIFLLSIYAITSQVSSSKNTDLVNISKVKKEIIKEKEQIAKKLHPKKEAFLKVMVPIATDVYKDLYFQYYNAKKHIETNSTGKYIEDLKKEYKVKTDKELLEALKPHPISIALAQCAMESAWLTSRFAKEANNLFGVWSFDKNEPRIAASGLRGDKTIYLKKYKNYYDSLKDYYKTISKSWAFKEFREKRLLTDDPFKLLPYLHKYSEQKHEYPKTLEKVIRRNGFTKYDIKHEGL